MPCRMPLALALAAFTMFVPRLAIAEEKHDAWRTLPLIEEGKVHPNWKQIGWGSFGIEAGALRTDCDERGMGLLLYAPEKFGNCQIRVVYRSKDPKSNAGVFVRIDDGVLEQTKDKPPAIKRTPDNKLATGSLELLQEASRKELGPWYAVHHGYEVQICDDADANHRTGAIYSLAKADAAPAAKPGDWRTMIITLKGTTIIVEIDGKQVTAFDSGKPLSSKRDWYEPKREPERPETGYIGLQNHDPGDIVYFKEVSIRPLAP